MKEEAKFENCGQLIDTGDQPHRHKCPNGQCGHIWEHGNGCYGDDKAHTCPLCGWKQFDRYHG
jgi:predicted RNA-binding Zn-ribbon protein involved in translation (DUF1610 family)